MIRNLSAEDQRNLQLEILQEVDTFCRNNGIKYSLAFGTLLGAIRHKGFIPWDDDIDIIMPLPDMIRFKNSFISPNLKYCDVDTEDYYCNPFSNISHNRTYRKEGLLSRHYYGLGLDLYPVVGFPSSEVEGNRFFQALNRQNVKRRQMINIRRRFIQLFPFHSVPCFTRVMKDYTNLMLYSYDYAGADSFFITGPLSWSFVFDFNLFADLIEVSFEGHKFLATARYDEWLKKRYGDYLSLPPIEQRIPHHGQTYYWK